MDRAGEQGACREGGFRAYRRKLAGYNGERVLLFGYCKELFGAFGNGHSVKIAVSGNIGYG